MFYCRPCGFIYCSIVFFCISELFMWWSHVSLSRELLWSGRWRVSNLTTMMFSCYILTLLTLNDILCFPSPTCPTKCLSVLNHGLLLPKQQHVCKFPRGRKHKSCSRDKFITHCVSLLFFPLIQTLQHVWWDCTALISALLVKLALLGFTSFTR